MYKHQANALAGFKLSALAITVSASLQITTAHAEQTKELAVTKATAQDKSSYKVDQSTSAKYSQPLLNTAKTITVIPESVMKDRNVDSLRDALRNVPGISLAAGEGGAPTGDSMSIRGFSARNDIMIDNVRDIAGYSRDTYNIEAVEVAKGPGSAVYGRGSTGGSINLQTKTAKLDDFTDVSLRLGSESDYRGQVDTNIKLTNSAALRINLLTDDGDVAGRDKVYNSKNAGAVSFASGLGSKTRVTVNADYQKQDNLPDYGLPWVPNYSSRDDRDLHQSLKDQEGSAPPVDYSNFYGSTKRDFEDIKAQSITATLEHDLNSSTTVRALMRTGSVKRKSIVNAPRFTYETIDDVRVYGQDGKIGLNGEKTRDTKDSLTVAQLDLLGSYQLGGIEHDIVAGVEFAREKFERWIYDDNKTDNFDTDPVLVDLYHPDVDVAYTGNYQRLGKDDEATGDTSAIYLFDTMTLNSQWLVNLGLRYDVFETEYFYDLSGDDPSVKISAENKELSWNLGLVYKPSKDTSIYFGAGNSFNPTAEDLTASTRENSNQNDLDPEETISYELGAKWALFDGRLNTSAAIFRTEKTNALTDDPYFSADSDQSRFDTLNGKQRVDGIELSVAGQINDQLTFTAGYTFQDSEVVDAEGDDAVQIGLPLARTPEHSFNLWGRYQISQDLAAGLGAQYVDERYNSTDPGGREKADDYLIFDVMVSYQINNQWNLQLNGENLSDEEYQEQLGGGHFVPGDGRHFTLSTRYSF